MHDLNDALDELRHVIPYAHSPSVRKLSKIATLLLAKNYILMQTNALNELRKILICLQQHFGSSLPQTLSSSITNLIGNSTALISPHSQPPPSASSVSASKQDTWSTSGGSAAPKLTSTERPGFDAKRGQAKGQPGVDEQQATSVQNRRRKYNILINRILGDVAGQHLLAGSLIQQPRQQLQQQQQQHSQSASNNPRPIDFCTQNKSTNALNSNQPTIGEGQICKTAPSFNPKRKFNATQLESKKARYYQKQTEAIKCEQLLMNNSTIIDRLSPMSNLSVRSTSSCSSLVSVGSPQYKS